MGDVSITEREHLSFYCRIMTQCRQPHQPCSGTCDRHDGCGQPCQDACHAEYAAWTIRLLLVFARQEIPATAPLVWHGHQCHEVAANLTAGVTCVRYVTSGLYGVVKTRELRLA